MFNERTYRSLSFQDGTEVRLADGNVWTLPAAAALLEQGETLNRVDEGLSGLLGAIPEAEDRSEQLRAELALAIHLLGWNYRLGPNEYRTLLEFAPGSPLLGTSQQAFHAVAMDYASRWRSRPHDSLEPASAPALLAGWWTSLNAPLRFLPLPRFLRIVGARLIQAAGVASR
jgi:hypothetical protein